jgi:hypothetical protein
MVTDVLGHSPHPRFYEKVIKVKADVAAVLNCFFLSCIDLGWVTWGGQERRRNGAFILTLDSFPSHLQSSSERSETQFS